MPILPHHAEGFEQLRQCSRPPRNPKQRERYRTMPLTLEDRETRASARILDRGRRIETWSRDRTRAGQQGIRTCCWGRPGSRPTAVSGGTKSSSQTGPAQATPCASPETASAKLL